MPGHGRPGYAPRGLASRLALQTQLRLVVLPYALQLSSITEFPLCLASTV
jgi:hypothetical protein